MVEFNRVTLVVLYITYYVDRISVHLCIDIITQKNTATNETLEISFHSTCLRRENSVCEYKCPPNYVPVDKSKPTLTCQIDGWDRETHPLCEGTCFRIKELVSNGCHLGLSYLIDLYHQQQ